MARLSLSLLGAFQATLDGEPITAFESAKTRALLAYLVVESGRPHRRETLAGLLWPEQPDRVARNNLRHTLSALRTAIGDRDATPPVLLVTRETVQFNNASDCWLDVRAFRALLEDDPAGPPATQRLGEALSLYRGPFLEGFSVSESPTFEDWALRVQERLGRQASTALQRLVREYLGRREYERACEYAWRWVELEPWREEAHRQLMRPLALSGQRGTALAQYEVCRKALRRELDVEPSEATTRLYEQIRDGVLVPPSSLPSSPDLVAQRPALPSTDGVTESPLFVGREGQLAQLEGHLRLALNGHGRTVFVTGEAGQGKTALMQAFVTRAQDACPQLAVGSGYCNAYTGIGDPYLPFREILEMLTGDVDVKVAAGAIGEGHAQRLRRLLPQAAQALLTDGPDLINVFVPGAALFRRAIACVSTEEGWLNRLQALVERKAGAQGTDGVRQDDLFEQYTTVLKVLARQVPLLLVLDDLQWADLGSVSLLFHLGRRLEGSPVLVVGAYRSEEVALGREGERHPLEPVVNELKRAWGDVEIDLAQAEGEQFVTALVASEPNRLGAGFRHMLSRQTGGHPLFTVELLKGMQERGDLIQDAEGRWVEGPRLDWEILPARVEAVIAERVNRLPTRLKDVLRAASVEGEVFTAEIVARTQAVDEGEMVASLSGELDRRHRLVRAQGIEQVPERRLSRYRFRHILFQKYLYNSLDPVERARLHDQVGTALETLYGQRREERAAVVSQLAWHFEQAGMPAQAIRYLQEAGERALRMSANEEAVLHLTRGIELTAALPDALERSRRELALQLALGVSIIATKSWGAPEASRAYARARELCRQVGDTSQVLRAMVGMRSYYEVRAEHRTALELAQEHRRLALRLEDPLQVMLSHHELAVPLMFVGEFARSLAHTEQLMALYDPQSHRSLAFVYGQDPGVVARSISLYDLWYLGYPDQALRTSQQAFALAKELDHPFSWAFLWTFVGRLYRWCRDVQMVQQSAESLQTLWEEYSLPLAEPDRMMSVAWVLSRQGRHEEGIAQFRQGLAVWEAIGMANHLPEFLSVLAEMQGKAGRPEEGLSTIDEVLAIMDGNDERYYEPEVYRLRGELLLMQGPDHAPQAEADYHRAIDVARRQSAKMSELRATVSLCRLWLAQERGGKRQEGHEMLGAVYGWFTEGFDTVHLKEARALLDAL